MPRLGADPGGRHLDFLENPCGPPPAAVEAARAAARSLGTYPDPRAARLRAALSDRLGLADAAISFGTGSAEVVERLIRTFVRPGEAVLSTDPTWPMLDRICAAQGVELRTVPYDLDRAAPRASIGAGRLLAAMDSRVRLVYLANPDFPLAAWMDEEQLRGLLDGLAVPLVVDEAYVEFAPRRAAVVPGLVAAGHRLVGVRTFSKFYGLAGLRLGYAFGHPALIDAAARLETGFAVPAFTEAAALAALGDRAHGERTLAALAGAAAALRDGLARRGLRWLDSDVNFMMAECPCPPERLFDALHAAGLHVPEVAWNGFVMLPVATAEDSERIADVLARLP
jgi:histidinol-phosphate aminotransferase